METKPEFKLPAKLVPHLIKNGDKLQATVIAKEGTQYALQMDDGVIAKIKVADVKGFSLEDSPSAILDFTPEGELISFTRAPAPQKRVAPRSGCAVHPGWPT